MENIELEKRIKRIERVLYGLCDEGCVKHKEFKDGEYRCSSECPFADYDNEKGIYVCAKDDFLDAF